MSRDKLLMLLTPWWVKNGWNPDTLKSKPDHQLFGIYNRAVNDGWRIKGGRANSSTTKKVYYV